MASIPNIDTTLLNQPYTLVSTQDEKHSPFNDLHRIGNSGGGADLDNKLCHFGRGGYCYTFSFNEATCQAREMAHAEVSLGSTEFFLGNKLHILMKNEPCCGRNSPLLILRLCDCKLRCELETRIDTTTLKSFAVLAQLSYGEASTLVTLSFEAACTEEYHVGKKNEPGNYKHLLYYAFLKRKLLTDIFPVDNFLKKNFTGTLPTISIIMPQTQFKTLRVCDNLYQLLNYKRDSLISSSSIEMAFSLLKIGLDHKILELIAVSCRTIMEKIGLGEKLHPPDLWKLYGIVRPVYSVEIVVILKMTIVCALRKILMKWNAPRSRVPAIDSDLNKIAQINLSDGQLQPLRKRCYESGS